MSILEGDDPRTARPVLTTRDPAVLRSLGEALSERLKSGAAANEKEVAEILELLPKNGGGDGD